MISNDFENGLLEQIIINIYTIGNLNDIDIHENNVTFVQILRIFDGNKTLIAKINIVISIVSI